MRVFLTGATGFIGTAIARELQSAGHQILGLARSEAAAATLRQAGVEPHFGDLLDHDALASGARGADGVIHTAYIHDFSNIAAPSDIDAAAVSVMAQALKGSGKPLIITSGVTVLPQGRLGSEADAPDPASVAKHRLPSERLCLEAVANGVGAMIVRPAPSVHGSGDHGFIPFLYSIAKQRSFAAYVEDGANRWPAVHVLDAARLYRLALEKGAAGAIYHAVADRAVPFRHIAEVIARHLGVQLVALRRQEAASYFGGFEGFAALDLPTSSEWTQKELGWTPSQIDLLTDIGNPGYFRQSALH